MRKIRRKLIIPEKSTMLAEETGIHIGDGSMNFYRNNGKNHWGYVHSSHLDDDKQYRKYVKRLMKKLYNLTPYEKVQKKCVMLIYTRKDLIHFKQNLGLPMGKKDCITIPQWILDNEQFVRCCIRGIVDTDGCMRFRKPFKGKLHSYPNVKITNKSKKLINQLQRIFVNFGLSPSVHARKISPRSPNIIYTLNLNGRKNLSKYMDLFSFSNPKHTLKYLFWKNHGFYRPNSLHEITIEL